VVNEKEKDVASTPVQEGDWPNQKKVVAGVVPQSKVSQDPYLHGVDETVEDVMREMGE
jgi:hypothetical protein